jgi:hypothetical protein
MYVLPQEKHPSALVEFESVLAAADGKQIVMFLDYDGTLSPIVKDPDTAVMTEEVSVSSQVLPCHFLRRAVPSNHAAPYVSPQMREAVRGVAEHFPTAIVSGRCRDKVHSSSRPSIRLLAWFILPFPFLCLAAFYKYSTCCAFSCVAQYCQTVRVSVMPMAPVQCPGVQFREAGRAVLRREPWHGHQGTHRPVQAHKGKC